MINALILILDEDDLPGGKIPQGTAQQKRYNSRTGRYFDSDNIARARNFFMAHFKKMRFLNEIDEPFKGPTELRVTFVYKARTKKAMYSPKLTRPDLDNSVKLIADCIVNSGILFDDNQIFRESLLKMYGPKERIVIEIVMQDDEKELIDELRKTIGE